MTPKKVWGVIVIVIGLLLIFSGAVKYSEAKNFSHGMNFINKIFLTPSSKSVQIQTDNFVKAQKNKGMAGFLFGIVMAIGGTQLLKEQKEEENSQRTKFSHKSATVGNEFSEIQIHDLDTEEEHNSFATISPKGEKS